VTLNLANIPLQSANTFPHAAAILMGDLTINYQQLSQQIIACAVAFEQQDLQAGDHIALMLPSVPQFTISYFGAISMVATIVPLNVFLLAKEIEYHSQRH